MNALNSLLDLQQKLRDREIALSDGILEAMKLLRTKLPEHVNVWLNRELTGLNVEELKSFEHLNLNYFKVRYISNGVWCEQPVQGVFVEKDLGCSGIFLSLGVQSIEAELAEFLHLEELISTDQNIPEEFEERFMMVQLLDRPGFYFRCYVRDLLRVYSGLRAVLIQLLQVISASYFGPALIYR